MGEFRWGLGAGTEIVAASAPRLGHQSGLGGIEMFIHSSGETLLGQEREFSFANIDARNC